MKLHEYIAQLQEFVADNPECGDMEVVSKVAYNLYEEIDICPEMGIYDEDDKEFVALYEGIEPSQSNAVCIN